MVGLGTLLFLLSLWYGAVWVFRRDCPKSKWFLRPRRSAGVASVHRDGGRLGGHRGRAATLDRVRLHEGGGGRDRRTTGVWITFVVIAVLYVGVAVTLVLVLRTMSRRFREGGERAVEDDGPYGPRAEPAEVSTPRAGAGAVSQEQDVSDVDRGRPVLRDHRVRAVRRGRLRRRLLGSRRGRRRAGRPPPRGGRPLDRPVWEANHVWLIFVLVVLWTAFSEAFASIMLTLFVPLSLAALGIVLRGSSFAFRKEVVPHVESRATSAPRSRSRRCSCRSAWAPSRARSRRAASRRGRGRRHVVELDQPDVDPRRRARGRRVRVPRGGLHGVGRAALRRRRDGRVLPPARRWSRRSSPARRPRRHLRARTTTPVRVRRPHVARRCRS